MKCFLRGNSTKKTVQQEGEGKKKQTLDFADERHLIDSIVTCHTRLAAEHRVVERRPQEEQAEQEPAALELAALCWTQCLATGLVQQQTEDLCRR